MNPIGGWPAAWMKKFGSAGEHFGVSVVHVAACQPSFAVGGLPCGSTISPVSADAKAGTASSAPTHRSTSATERLTIIPSSVNAFPQKR
ncbi:MAG: hypothetical protein JSS97_10985 [Actinobacteria bacterium]|nr:hypothetical protein [Actinomycetota bacterium]